MKVPVYNQQGEELKKIDLPENIFGVVINDDLVHQVAVCQMANKRQGNAHTKDRAEVRGGGRKPWRQKGTGRARHGSTRSPIWRGGGVTFGPRNEKNYKKIIPQKMRKKALSMVLSGKLKDNQIVIIDNLKKESLKTRDFLEIINKLPMEHNALIILPQREKNIVLGTRNLANIEVMSAKDINVLELLSFKNLVVSESAIEVIKKNFIVVSPKTDN